MQSTALRGHFHNNDAPDLVTPQGRRADEENKTRSLHGVRSNSTGYVDTLTPSATIGELHPAHRKSLEEDSAISAEAIAARGYFTQTDRHALELLGFERKQCLPPSLVIPLYNWRGERAGYALRPEIPRNGATGKPLKYESPAGVPPVLDVSPLTARDIDDPTKPLIVTEGAKKADSAASRGPCAINIGGIYSFRGKNAKGGITALADWENIALKERAVYIAFDSDVSTKPQVASALERLAAFLKSRGALVKIVYLPDGPNGSKTGLDDFFARGSTLAEFFNLARDLATVAEKRENKKKLKSEEVLTRLRADGLPLIETSGRQQSDALRDLSAAIEQYNTSAPRVFRGIGGLGMVRIEEELAGKPRIKAATRDAVLGIAGEAARWISTSEREGVRDVAPPRDLCGVFLAMPELWRGIPVIEGTATAPFFAENGELCATPGYHAAARTWLSLPANFVLPDTSPTPENIASAKVVLLDKILGEVAFADAASKAHAVAQIILPFVRRLIHGPTPLHLWSAPLRGSGKSYTASACILPFTVPTPTPEKASPEEWRKSILCELVTGPSHVFIDNIKGTLNSSALDSAITEETMRDRLTGTGEMVTAKTDCVWVATANNAELTEDAATRALVIRIDPDIENPDQREFKSDPKAFIKANRAQVCGAIITLVRAWQAAGTPSYGGPHHWRFPQWQSVIGGILETSGIEGFLDNLATERAFLSTGGDDWAELVALWHEMHGEAFVTAKELLPLAEKVLGVAASLEKSEGPQRARKLMSFVRGRRDRVYNGLKITAGPKIDRQASYRLQSSKAAHSAHSTHSVLNARIDTKFQKLEEEESKNEILCLSAPYSNNTAQSAQCASEVESEVLS
jgi:hypothetical protein